MITETAKIIPPLLRADLIAAGLHHDCEAIDAIHKHARDQYPELFRPDDNPGDWGKPSNEQYQNLHRIK